MSTPSAHRPNGMLIDAERLEMLADSLREALGQERVAKFLGGPRTVDATGLDILEGFTFLHEWLTDLREGREPPSAELMLKFAMVATIISNGLALAGSEDWRKKLRSHAFLPDSSPFYDKLFEGEFAWLWCTGVARMRGAAAFGPPSGHPDVWLAGPTQRGLLRIPAECKRVSPRGQNDSGRDAFADALAKRLRALTDERHPIKCVVWLHRHVYADDVSAVATLIEEAMGESRKTDFWVTRFDAAGMVQVSVAALGSDGEFGPHEISIPDLEAKGFVHARSELKRTTYGDLKRLRSVLSVRSDVTSDRIGSLKKHFRKAASAQLPRAPGDVPGVVALRIRPPQAIGDLFEADRVVRAEMERADPQQVALAVLLWNEAERRAEATEVEGDPVTNKFLAYHLRAYYVTNRRSTLRIGPDSYEQYFGAHGDTVVRDPIDGSLKPVDVETLALLRDGGELPPTLRDAVRELGELDSHRGTTTLYWESRRPWDELRDEELMSVLQAGDRQIRTFRDVGLHLRTVDIVRGVPRRVCTIDLRAWAHLTELCVVMRWTTDSLSVGIWSPDENTLFEAVAADLPEVPTAVR